MAEENEVTANKLTEENQVTMKEPQRVTTKNLKKVEAGKKLAEYNRKKRDVKKREEAQAAKTAEWGEASELNQYYGIGAVLAVGVIGGFGYYIY